MRRMRALAHFLLRRTLPMSTRNFKPKPRRIICPSHHGWLCRCDVTAIAIASQNEYIADVRAHQAATTVTMNSPPSLTALFHLATTSPTAVPALSSPTATAEFMREVGLKCISFNGIPRTINCLNGFHDSLPASVRDSLTTTPTRHLTGANADSITARGHALWDSIYRPFETKLFEKLSQSHPDLSVVIVDTHYGALLSDPSTRTQGQTVGRFLTSLVAVACLRAQTGTGPQLTSHIFGLRKALDDGTWKLDIEGKEGVEWLASDEGNMWILEAVDEIVNAISQGEGSSFAPGKAKL